MSNGVLEIPKNITTKIFEKFFNNVNQTNSKDDCWEWTARLNDTGYGILSIGKRQFRAHRFSYYVQYNTDPIGWTVRHKCDNPACCNPYHLVLGTQQDNVDDMKERGRMAFGEKYSKSKRTAAEVLEIRRLFDEGMSRREIAEKFNIPRSSVISLILRREWKHI